MVEKAKAAAAKLNADAKAKRDAAQKVSHEAVEAAKAKMAEVKANAEKQALAIKEEAAKAVADAKEKAAKLTAEVKEAQAKERAIAKETKEKAKDEAKKVRLVTLAENKLKKVAEKAAWKAAHPPYRYTPVAKLDGELFGVVYDYKGSFLVNSKLHSSEDSAYQTHKAIKRTGVPVFVVRLTVLKQREVPRAK